MAELSLDGMGEFHDQFRGSPGAFDKAMETYDALAELQETDPRLRIHAISTATDVNMDEIRRLTPYLFERCPKMDHHNLALIRGDRKNPSLQGPNLAQYQELYDYVRRLWAPREEGRYGSVVEPMLQWAKSRTAAAEQRQVVPCRAGILNAVVYSNGDVSVCENHAPLGNLRREDFSGDLELARSGGAAEVDRRERVLLHQRGFPVAQHHLSSRINWCGHGRRQGVAERDPLFARMRRSTAPSKMERLSPDHDRLVSHSGGNRQAVMAAAVVDSPEPPPPNAPAASPRCGPQARRSTSFFCRPARCRRQAV